jgi:hypothetical protein
MSETAITLWFHDDLGVHLPKPQPSAGEGWLRERAADLESRGWTPVLYVPASTEAPNVQINLGADSLIQEESRFVDWGALVVESQGGTSVFVVGLSAYDAAALLREAAGALDASQSPPS